MQAPAIIWASSTESNYLITSAGKPEGHGLEKIVRVQRPCAPPPKSLISDGFVLKQPLCMFWGVHCADHGREFIGGIITYMEAGAMCRDNLNWGPLEQCGALTTWRKGVNWRMNTHLQRRQNVKRANKSTVYVMLKTSSLKTNCTIICLVFQYFFDRTKANA